MDIIPTVTVSVGDLQTSFLTGNDVICSDHVTLQYISSLLICKTLIRGRFVTIQVDETISPNYISLCEVQILAEGNCRSLYSVELSN